MSHLLTSPPEPVSLARLFAQTAQLMRRDLALCLGLALVLAGGGTVLEGLLRLRMGAAGYPPWAVAFAPWLAAFAPFVLADMAIVCAALERLSGRRPTLAGVLAGAVRLAPVALLIDLVEGVPDIVERAAPLIPMVATGRLSLLVTALFFLAEIVWIAFIFPALAVASQERAGPLRSLARAWVLTRRQRGRTMIFLLVVNVVRLGAPVLLYLGLFFVVGPRREAQFAAELVGTPFLAFSSAAQAVFYWELTRLRLGVAPGEAEEVFD